MQFNILSIEKNTKKKKKKVISNNVISENGSGNIGIQKKKLKKRNERKGREGLNNRLSQRNQTEFNTWPLPGGRRFSTVTVQILHVSEFGARERGRVVVLYITGRVGSGYFFKKKKTGNIFVEVCEGAAHNDGDASGVWVCFVCFLT